MAEGLTFNEVKEKHLKTLELYTPIVAKVHGKNHPEFLEAHRIFESIREKIKEAKSNKPELRKEFAELREITKGYMVPDDTCESYEAVYKMLEDLDKAYED